MPVGSHATPPPPEEAPLPRDDGVRDDGVQDEGDDRVPAVSHDPHLTALLASLKRSRGFDFGSYKPATLTRRIARRLQTLQLDGYAAYQDHLQVHPDEFAHLFNSIL